MEIAGKIMTAILPENIQTDDWMWNEHAFQFVLIQDNYIITDPYRFIIDPNDVFERSEICQLKDWIYEKFWMWFDDIKYKNIWITEHPSEHHGKVYYLKDSSGHTRIFKSLERAKDFVDNMEARIQMNEALAKNPW
jgi:hypothetical protein